VNEGSSPEPGATAAELLDQGRAFADLSRWRKVAVEGAEALAWLDALVTADLEDLAPGRARRAAFLSPTGAVLAEFTVAVVGGTPLLLQDPAQPRPVDDLLAPYVLSSDVRLRDRTEELGLFSFPGRSEPPNAPGGAFSAPSALGAGVDVVCLEEDREPLRTSFARAFAPASEEDVEAWRVARGIARLARDGAPGDLPAECGLDGVVSRTKGCYLGQEAVARVANLGHPRRVLVHVTAAAPLRTGEAVLAEGREVGRVTSAARFGDRWYALVRVRWEWREAPLRTASGASLVPADRRA
jgi:folate-binding protein YgfZ